MAALLLNVTNAGLAAVTAASGTAPTVIAQLGMTSQHYDFAPTLTALPGEFKRLTSVAGAAVGPNLVHLEARDDTDAVWSATGLGLYLDDGTLFAALASDVPVLSKAGLAFAVIALDVAFTADVLANITFGDLNFSNPPATTENRGVVEMATIPEAKAGSDALRALSPAAAAAAILDWIGYTPLNAASYTAQDILAKLVTVDGAGAGLDADLLDGQHGAYYADVPGRLGYTPLNAATYTAPDVLAKLLTVDGAGSGLDADLLDGQHASYYTDIFARLGFVPLNSANYTAQDVLAKLLTVDGAGSGLDGDLLDGQHGAYYADVPGRLGYTPLNAATYTALDVLAKLLTVDGADSGLDADLLDGQHASYYTDIFARLGFVPLNSASYTAQDVLAKLLTVDGAGSGLDADLLDGQHGAYYADVPGRLGYTPLNATAYTAQDILAKLLPVDGANSGLDADLLDGQQGSFYTDIVGRLGYTPMNAASYNDFLRAVGGNIATDGYVLLSNGMKIMRGEFTINKDTYANVTFPHAFDNPPSVVFPTAGGGGDISYSQNLTLTGTTATGFTAWQSGDITVTTSYIAIGA